MLTEIAYLSLEEKTQEMEMKRKKVGGKERNEEK
jgi:hypothetical protein